MSDRIQQIAGIVGVLGLFLSGYQNVQAFSLLAYQNFWLVLGAALLLCCLSFWPDPREPEHRSIGFTTAQAPATGASQWRRLSETVRRFRGVLICVVIAIAISAHHIWELNRTVDGRFYPSPAEILGYLIAPPAFAQDQTATQPKIIQFRLWPERTSFTLNMSALHADGPQIKTFALAYNEMSYIWNGRCTPDVSANESEIRESLSEFARSSGRHRLLPYLDDQDRFLKLVKERPDIAERLMPRRHEWSRMNPAMRDQIIKWVLGCIGIPYPVFMVSLENPASSELLVTRVIYDVKSIGQVKGGESGPQAPDITYVHKLPYEVGQHLFDLNSPYKLGPKAVGSFALQLWTDYPDVGLTWEMRVRLETNHGTVETPYFQLIMSGEPTWKRGGFK